MMMRASGTKRGYNYTIKFKPLTFLSFAAAVVLAVMQEWTWAWFVLLASYLMSGYGDAD